MRLIALVDSPTHVCCRYRLAAFRPFLEAAGHSLEFIAWPRNWLARLTIGRALRGANVVILQRRLLPAYQLALVRRAARHLIFDFDDAVFLRDSYARGGIHSPRRLRRFADVVHAADAVVSGNRFLDAQAGRWAGSDRRIIIPTCVDPSRYPLARHDGARLVWVGSSSTLQGLEAIGPLLEGIGQHVPGVRLKLICDRFLTLRHLPVEPCPWVEATQAAELAEADIGISWVPNDDWSRGKCGLKVLQYMAAGLPVIANRVGVQAEFVTHGESGFLADTPEEWQTAVSRLTRDPELRRRMGQAGRKRVEAEFSVRHGAALWLDLLTNGASRRPARGVA